MTDAQSLSRKLGTLDDLKDVIRTLKVLSSANLRQFEAAVASLVDYDRTIELGLRAALNREPPAGPLHSQDPATRQQDAAFAAIAFGTDYGLCGRLNQALSEHAIEQMNASGIAAQNRYLIVVGARLATQLEDAGQPVHHQLSTPASPEAIPVTVGHLLTQIDALNEQARLEKVWIFYNQHTLRGASNPATEHLLPFDKSRRAAIMQIRWPGRMLPSFTMPRKQLLASLIRQALFVSLARACGESLASEHQARLLATQAAEKNIDDARTQAGAEYRTLRQHAITAEILDVISGYEASNRPPP